MERPNRAACPLYDDREPRRFLPQAEREIIRQLLDEFGSQRVAAIRFPVPFGPGSINERGRWHSDGSRWCPGRARVRRVPPQPCARARNALLGWQCPLSRRGHLDDVDGWGGGHLQAKCCVFTLSWFSASLIAIEWRREPRRQSRDRE